MIKVLNLYAGIGGNRKLWQNVDVTAVEINKNIAAIYQDLYPNDKVIVADAHEYLLKHYKEYDFIWSSPPCPTHSKLNLCFKNNKNYEKHIGYIDMKLYQEIIFLKHFSNCKWVVENVTSFYEPLIKPYKAGRHYFWANFNILNFKENRNISIAYATVDKLSEHHEINIEEHRKQFDSTEYRKMLRNMVNKKLGLHIFNCAYKTTQKVLI